MNAVKSSQNVINIYYILAAFDNDEILAAFDNEQDSLKFLDFLNKSHANIKFTIEKQINHSITFLNVFTLQA